MLFIPDDNNKIIARYERSEETSFKEMDVAIAEIVLDQDWEISNRLIDDSKTIDSSIAWLRGMPLTKYGAGTERTQCKLIKAYDQFSDLQNGLELGAYPGSNNEYCDHGDSGAIWCDPESGNAVALHSREGVEGKAYATPVILILQRMGLSIFLEQ